MIEISNIKFQPAGRQGQISNFQRGFTLIELMVAIAIIGLLVAIGLTNFLSAQQTARDTRRKADLRAIRDAMEVYYSDIKQYPCDGSCPAAGSWDIAVPSSITGLEPTYIAKIPNDPVSGNACPSSGQPSYLIVTNGSSYTLYANLEIANDRDAQAVKPAPVLGTSSDGNKTVIVNGGAGTTCNGQTFNFWLNNP